MRGVTLTGSERAGTAVAAAAGKNLPADDPHRRHSGQPGLPDRVLRPGQPGVPGRGRGRGVAVAVASRYGLGGSVFSRDTARGERVARRVETGMVFVNHPTAVKADIPFGGVKVSGYGNELTEFGIREFATNKVIDVVDIDAPFWLWLK